MLRQPVDPAVPCETHGSLVDPAIDPAFHELEVKRRSVYRTLPLVPLCCTVCRLLMITAGLHAPLSMEMDYVVLGTALLRLRSYTSGLLIALMHPTMRLLYCLKMTRFVLRPRFVVVLPAAMEITPVVRRRVVKEL